MFAALAGDDEVSNFIKAHIKRFIAMAPVVKLKNMGCEPAQDLKDKEMIVSGLKKLGPELFTKGTMESPLTKAFLSSALGTAGGQKVMTIVSDKDTTHISDRGAKNYFKFFPAGTSVKCILHFR